MKKTLTRRAAALGLALGAGLCGMAAQAQAWPARSITIIVGYPAGGDTDVMARVYGEKLAALLKQTVVVDNKPGASGTLSAGIVAKAPADGYTLLFAPNTFAVAPLVLKGGVPMDVVKDFTPVAQVGSSPLALLAGPQSGLKDIRTLVSQAKGGKAFSYATPGSGSPMHLMGELFNRTAALNMTHVPYRGVAPSLTDAMGGHVALVWSTPGAAAAYLADNKLVPLAVTGDVRSPSLPNVPTMVELGYKDVRQTAWWGFFGPRGLPSEVVHTMEKAMEQVIRMPDVRAKLATMMVTPEVAPGAQLGRRVASDYERFGKVVRDYGIQAD